MSKYGYLMLPGAFPDKFTPDFDFIDEAVFQYYDVPVVKIGARNLGMITSKFICEY